MNEKSKNKPDEASAKEKEKKSKFFQLDEQIKELEQQISQTKYNKSTQHAIGLYKARLATLKEKKEARSASKVGKSEQGWSVRKSGDASVVLLGFPSVGKSSLLNAITNANSPVGAYAFTTLTCIPGLLDYKGARIQILDVPGVVKGAAAGTGRGKEVLQVLRNADLIIILLDVFHPDQLNVLLKEIFDSNIRINQKRPDVQINKTERGGTHFGITVKLTEITKETMEGILHESHVVNADLIIREDIDADQLIDIIKDNRKYITAIKILNKIDLVDDQELKRLTKILKPDLCVSAEKKINTEELKKLIFQKLDFMPVYCKEVGKEADMNVPLILKKGNTVEDMCRKLHNDFIAKFRFVRVWGKSAKFPGQKLSLKHKLREDDIVELHIS